MSAVATIQDILNNSALTAAQRSTWEAALATEIAFDNAVAA